jgi:hypothetical protein
MKINAETLVPILMVLGGLAGGLGGLFLGTYIAFAREGDGQAVFGGICCGVPISVPLGVCVVWLIAKGWGKATEQ